MQLSQESPFKKGLLDITFEIGYGKGSNPSYVIKV